MNEIPIKRWLALSLAAITPWASLTAQNETPNGEEEVFELSPFEVNADSEEGYRATSTTAGSRLNTQLKDVAASVTVLTDAFMDDLGATDIDDALSMVAGVETSLTTDTQGPHLSQGFMGSDFNDPNASESSVRVRGLGQATQSANYLQVRGPIDRYNMERTEFLRGPNALLFGLGLPGGVVNYSTKKAHLARDINKVDIVLDNFGTRRLSVDVSRPLIEDKLAVRAVSVYEDERYKADTARNLDKKLFITARYKPFENTRIDAYYETTHANGRRPNYRLPQDNVSQWLKYWNEAHKNYSGAELEQHLNENFYWDASWAQTSQGAAPPSRDYTFEERHRLDGNGDPATFQPRFRNRLDGRDKAPTGYYTNSDWFTPSTSEGGYTTLYGAWNTQLRDPTNGFGGNAKRDPEPRARLRFNRSGDPYDSRDRAYVDTQVTDPGIFPIFDQEIGTLPGNYRDVKSKKFGFSIDQKINQDLYIAASYLKETYSAEQNFAPLAQTQSISLDVNRYLPGAIQNPGLFTGTPYKGVTIDGGTVQPSLELAMEQAQMIVNNPDEPEAIRQSNQAFIDQVNNRVLNPNFLRPFIHGRAIGGANDYESESAMAQFNYDFDFATKSDRLGFLGFHRLTGFASYSKSDELSYRFSNGAAFDPAIANVGSQDQESFRRLFWPIFYIGDAVQPGDTSLNITGLPASTTPYLGNRTGHRYFTDENSHRGEWLVNEEGLDIRPLIIGRTLDFSGLDQEGWGASLQSFFWNRRIVTTLGLREDTVENIDYARRPDITPAWDFFMDGDERADWLTNDPIIVFEDTQQLVTKSLVFHATPWLRAFYNESENFDLTTPQVDAFHNAIPPQGGVTEEYGIGMSLMENKLDLKLNFFETSQVYQPIGNLVLAARIRGFENRIRSMLETLDRDFLEGEPTPYNIEDWERVIGRNADGTLITDNPGYRDDAVDEQGNPIFDSDGNPEIAYPDEGVEWVPANNVGITQDSVSEGWELTGTYNPNRNLRIRGSVSRLENRVANKHRQSLEYVRARSNYWNQFIQAGYHVNGDNDETVYITEEEREERYPDGEVPYNTRVLANSAQEPDANSLIASVFYGAFGSELLTALQDEGTSSVGISEYNARLTANYSFHEGMLQGFSFGTNLRWESGKALGYELIDVPDSDLPEGFPGADINNNGVVDSNEALVQRRDSENPLLGPSHVTGGVMANYRRTIMNDRVNWRIQLNVDNLFKQGDHFRIIRFNPDGSSIYGLNRPTTFKLTNSFEF